MKSIRSLLLSASIACLFILFLFSCSKDSSSSSSSVPDGSQRVSLFLTDDPALFDQVNIDIQSVKVLVDTCSNGDDNDCDDHGNGGHHFGNDDSTHQPDSNCRFWVDLGLTAGVYDLLSLRNGLDTLLASATIPDGRILKIRIDLGTNNSLVKDSISYPLNLPPNQNHYVILTLRGGEWDEFQPRNRRLWLDFDVARSIITINGNFYLRPVIHLFVVRNTGGIEGTVGPRNAFPVITVFNSTDTAYAIPNHEGKFKVRGLASGDYSLFVNASNGYTDTTINNISVTRGRSTRVDRITLHQ